MLGAASRPAVSRWLRHWRSRMSWRRDPARKQEAAVCAALEGQIWATLPSFCSWATDTHEAFKCETRGRGVGGVCRRGGHFGGITTALPWHCHRCMGLGAGDEAPLVVVETRNSMCGGNLVVTTTEAPPKGPACTVQQAYAPAHLAVQAEAKRAGRACQCFKCICLPLPPRLRLATHPFTPGPPPRCRLYAKDIALVFERRQEVRVSILTALRRLCVQNKLVLRAAGQQVCRALAALVLDQLRLGSAVAVCAFLMIHVALPRE